MLKWSLFGMALVLATTPLTAQTAASKPQQAKPAAQQGVSYVPAIMQPRQVYLAGCLQHTQDGYVLANATITNPTADEKKEPIPAMSYKVVGLAHARLTLLVGKHLEMSGAFQGDPRAASSSGGMGQYEATDVREVGEACQAS